MRARKQFLTGLALLGLSGVALASPTRATVISLPSTGTDSGGNIIVPGGRPDPHYSVLGPETGGASAVVYSPSNLWGQWVANDPHSAWIGFHDNSSSSPHGVYTYELKFDLTGYDPTTASVSGDWAADQFGSISLNGSSTGQSVSDGNWNAAVAPNLNPFTISSGFHSGLNILDFLVTEPDDFDGLRVRNVTLTATPVPEPSSTGLLMAVGAAVTIGLSRRHK